MGLSTSQLLWESFQRLKTTPGFPLLRHAELHITDRCNLRCYFCNQYVYRINRFSEIPFRLLKSLLAEMVSIGLREVRLSGGGEPTCYPRFEDLIDLLSMHHIALDELTTNGLLCGPRLLKKLFKLDWRWVQFSLSASTPTGWRRATRGPTRGFSRIISNIERLIEMRTKYNVQQPYVVLSFGVDPINIPRLLDSYRLGCRLGVDQVTFVGYSGIRFDVAPYVDQVFDQMQRIDDFSRRAKKTPRVCYSLRHTGLILPLIEKFQSKLKLPKSPDLPTSFCCSPWRETMVRANGDVEICCAFLCGRPRLGNIHRQSIKAIWYGKKYQALRQELEHLIRSPIQARKYSGRFLPCTAFAPPEWDCPLKDPLEDFLQNG